jgi:signal peptidase II
MAFAAVLFLVGRVLSSRIAGPLYAFEKFLDDLAAGKPRPLRLRAGDEFKHLEVIAARLSQQVIEKQLMKSQAEHIAHAESQKNLAATGSPGGTVEEFPSNVMPLKRSP